MDKKLAVSWKKCYNDYIKWEMEEDFFEETNREQYNNGIFAGFVAESPNTGCRCHP